MFTTNIYLFFFLLASLSVKLEKRFGADQLSMNAVIVHESVVRSSTSSYTHCNLYEVDRLSDYSFFLHTKSKQKTQGTKYKDRQNNTPQFNKQTRL
jgi:hypothetical protein